MCIWGACVYIWADICIDGLTYIFGTQAGGHGVLSGREPGSTAALLSLSERLTSPQGVALLTGGVAAGSGLG